MPLSRDRELWGMALWFDGAGSGGVARVACVEASDELQAVPARPISPLARLGAPKKTKHPITIMPPRRSEACPVSSVNPNHPTASLAKDVPSDPVTVLSIQAIAAAMLLELIAE